MIRIKEWKYNLYLGHGEELYDLVNDPEEMNNLAGDKKHEGKKQELRKKLIQFIVKEQDPFLSYLPTDRSGKLYRTVKG